MNVAHSQVIIIPQFSCCHRIIIVQRRYVLHYNIFIPVRFSRCVEVVVFPAFAWLYSQYGA